jgi:hypothetical protein
MIVRGLFLLKAGSMEAETDLESVATAKHALPEKRSDLWDVWRESYLIRP